MIKETSLEAFKEVRETLGERQLIVLEALKKIQPATNSMIARYLNLPINTITPRIYELRNKKNKNSRAYVAYAFTDICPITKRRAMFWRIIREVL